VVADFFSRYPPQEIGNICAVRESSLVPWIHRQVLKQERDPDVGYLMKSLSDPSSTEFVAANYKYFLDHDGIVYKERSGNEREDRLYAPKSMREHILYCFHETPFAGHQGRGPTYDLIKRQFHWPGLYEDVKSLCAKCESCALRKPGTLLKKGSFAVLSSYRRTFCNSSFRFSGSSTDDSER